MKPNRRTRSSLDARLIMLLMAFIAVWAAAPFALDGVVQIHDPSTIMQCDGKFYTYGTGGGTLVSDDGWTWRRGVVPARTGAAPDVIHIGDRYYMYISGVTMIWSKSLDPNSPDYKWEIGGPIVGKEGPDDFMNPIDPGLLLDPDGRLWLTYGSYFGYIRVVQLDPKTGKRVDPNDKPVNIAINCEASDMIYRDGWYYLLATHGSCCRGADSGYNIRVGRSRKATGPFLDHTGLDMLQGGGKLVIGSGGRFIGPGHFGLIDLGEGVQKFSMHQEADLDRGGASVLDIRPLLWRDGWPIAGENMKEGTYEIESVRTGTAIELAVEGMPVGGRRAGRGGGPGGSGAGAPGGGRGGQGVTGEAGQAVAAGGRGATGDTGQAGAAGGRGAQGGATGAAGAGAGRGMFGGTGSPIPPQDVAEVSKNWPAGNIDIRMSNYMCQAQQKWTITPVANAGGYLGSPYFKITIAGTDRTLAVGEDGELVALPAFTGGNQQLWRLDQLTDGTWRVMPKSASAGKESLALSAIGSSFATLAKFDPKSDKQRWLFKTP
ncbi:MAG: family 43 glycosylhydrolase [Acidobacteriia bacterium]|nr:family 43 glycosylhydrolase [Terriglobia bacterium]